MMLPKPAKGIMAILSVVLIVVLCFVRYNSINRQYPSPRIVRPAPGQSLLVDGAIEVSAKNLRVYMDEEFKTLYDISNEEYEWIASADVPTKFILADVEITNFSELTQGILDKYIFTIKSDQNWTNGLNVIAFGILNEGLSTPAYGESTTFTLVYTSEYLRSYKDAWDDLENADFELRVVRYPYRYVWELPA